MTKINTYKSKTTAVLLCLCLGALGAHRFYLGNPLRGIMYPIITVVVGVILPPAIIVITVLLCLEAVYLLCRGKAFYRRTVEMEVVA